MTTVPFEDRFSYPDPNGPIPGVSKEDAENLSEEDLLSLNPSLTEMIKMIKGRSVLLSSASAYEIFMVITTQVDPEIAGLLASEKSRLDNQYLIGGEGAIKEIMFADPGRPGRTNYTNRSIFAGMIRQACVYMSASILIGKYSQIAEQAEHAKNLYKYGLDKIDRVVKTWDLSANNAQSEKDKEQDIPGTFFFEPGEYVIPTEKELHVEWQSPSLSTGWAQVGTYTGTVETWQIVNDLSDSINSEGLYNPNSTLLASAVLSGPYIVNPSSPNSIQYHALEFYPRRPEPRIVAYSINIRVQIVLKTGQVDTSPDFKIGRAPFIWGTIGESLNDYSVNGAIILIRYNKLQGPRSIAEYYEPFVLYIRSKEGATIPGQSKLVYRVQPWNPNIAVDAEGDPITSIELEVNRLTDSDPAKQAELDANRFSQIAVLLTNSLASLNLTTGVAGALIRNDPITVPDACAGIELVSWSNRSYAHAILLDILELPDDIELAIGDRGRPTTYFSNKPRSGLRILNPMANSTGPIDGVLKKESALMSPKKKTGLWRTIKDETDTVQAPITKPMHPYWYR